MLFSNDLSSDSEGGENVPLLARDSSSSPGSNSSVAPASRSSSSFSFRSTRSRRRMAAPNEATTAGDNVLFRSEEMERCQLILQSEAAYNCISELGELGLVQFADLNPEVSAFQRKFVGEVKRCEEMERKLRYIQREIIRDGIQVQELDENPSAPPPREMTELETSLSQVERDLSDVNANRAKLQHNETELLEMRSLVRRADEFLSHQDHLTLRGENENGSNGTEEIAMREDADDANLIDGRDAADAARSMKFNLTAGVIDRAKQATFERILWRVSKGNVFIRFADLNEERLIDPETKEPLQKSVFLVFYQGEQLKIRVKKICEGYHAKIYHCPEKPSARREMMYDISTRLEDLSTVLNETETHRARLLVTGARNLRGWYTKVRKIKAIYHCLNLFSFDVTQKALVAECWMPSRDLQLISECLRRGADASGASLAPILNTVPTTLNPPTYNRTNKYTAGYQNLIDAYGVNTYREVNPAVYTIATFPFLFAVMFGDAGHGLLVLIAGLWMVFMEDKLVKMAEESEIFGIFFGGRYIITMMGVFSIYTGLIYNDVFSKSINLFGSHWHVRDNMTFPLELGKHAMLDPGDANVYDRHNPYMMGIDPAWQTASNKIVFLNTYKMKISLIFGLIHMVFGLMLSLWNNFIKKSRVNIMLEFLPQLVFLVSIFCYLLFMIFFKWTHYYAANEIAATNTHSEHCAPNILITFINMMLFKETAPDPKLLAICKGYETYMYPGQQTIQKCLVILGVLMVPIMLFGKPLYTHLGRRSRRRNYEPMSGNNISNTESDSLLADQSDSDAEPSTSNGNAAPPAHESDSEPEELPMSEVLIYQGIHTIEFVLGSVSHTASYLRLWALSLAHSQLSEVLWNMVMKIAFTTFGKNYSGSIAIYIIFSFWAGLTVSILVVMEGLSAFLHTLRLHWVEFNSKFYKGEGVAFAPFNFQEALKEAETNDKEVLKATP